jgi:hypothetical protein
MTSNKSPCLPVAASVPSDDLRRAEHTNSILLASFAPIAAKHPLKLSAVHSVPRFPFSLRPCVPDVHRRPDQEMG